MKRVLIFAYSFIVFMAIICTILIYLLTKKPNPVSCFHDPCEYQLTIEDDYVIVEDHGRTVVVLPIDETCTLGSALVKDNE